MNRDELLDVLKVVGKAAETVTSPDGTALVVQPYGGRVLGLYAADSDENFLWTHTALESTETAKAFYEGDQWHNSGGDRTWLAPEIDIFFPNFPKLDKYWQPRQLDPGDYQVLRTDGRVKLVNRLSINLSRSKRDIDLKLTKSYAPAPDPLRYERGLEELEGIEYAGYTQYTTLELLETSAETSDRVGLWNLLQMPHGGDLLVPTYARTEPRIYMGAITSEDLIVEDRLIRYKMRASGEHKLGIRATMTTGRVGYIYSSGPDWSLIIRNFFVDPSGEYVDVPWDDTEYFGFSVQACNINSGLGSFSELEYHVPAIGQGTGRTRCEDVSQVWAFRGSLESVRFVGKNLLTSDI